jgi:lysine-specific demethylase 8
MPLANITHIEEFEIESYYPEINNLLTPFVIKGGVKNWRAIKSWSPDYFLRIAGDYFVKLKPKADHVDGKSKRELEEDKIVQLKDTIELIFDRNSPNLSYIRESDLLSRCPLLAKDIETPIYLTSTKPHALPRTGSFDPKIWIGPENTVAQLHWDPEHNFYAQVIGRKKVIILAPYEFSKTYPNLFPVAELKGKAFFSKNSGLLHKLQMRSEKFLQANKVEQNNEFREYLKKELTGTEVSLLCDFLLNVNNCDVNAETPDLLLHPKFSESKRYEVILESGDLLFIPYFWYHYFRSLEPSVSVNWFFLPENLSNTISASQQLEILLCHLTL